MSHSFLTTLLDPAPLFLDCFVFATLLLQLPATAVLLSRLIKGPGRYPPLTPKIPTPEMLGQVSVVIPTLNEFERLTPCLQGLTRQGYEVREVIVVDSYSQDGTPDLVKAAQQHDPRFRLINDDPLPSGWVGRPWALHNGFLFSSSSSEWVLGIDADTQPQPGLVASLLKTAATEQYDLISLAPQFILKYPGELLLQPALLMTLVYRFGPSGGDPEAPDRVMANGQCFLCRRSLLEAVGGYSQASTSFCDDVTLARYIAAQGAKVGFLDGARLLKVRMYEGAAETWKEWGRSLDLKDASNPAQVWGDLGMLLAVQGLPFPMTLLLLTHSLLSGQNSLFLSLSLALNGFLLAIRFALLFAIAPSYDRTTATYPWCFWFSPLADPLAVLRIFLSSIRVPKQWRGRTYASF